MLNALNNKEDSKNYLDAESIESSKENNSNEITEKKEVTEGPKDVEALKEVIRDAEVGDAFFFGKMEQDNNWDNGAEPIEWIVLEKTANEAFVISRKVLEWLTFSQYDDTVKKYNEKGIVIGTTGTSNYFTWDIVRNQQRAWLSNELYVNGFTESEKALILLTSHETPSEGYATFEDEFDDYLYIPSQEEVEEHMLDVQLRTAEMTDYVAAKAKQETGEYIRWSLRSRATSLKSSMLIKEDGELGAMYTNVPTGVRPVMWLDIS